jgi:hypothetical protein
MWIYAISIVVIVVAAEAAGLGGAPTGALTIESLAFAGLLLASIVLAVKGYTRR